MALAAGVGPVPGGDMEPAVGSERQHPPVVADVDRSGGLGEREDTPLRSGVGSLPVVGVLGEGPSAGGVDEIGEHPSGGGVESETEQPLFDPHRRHSVP